jgi:glycosyltransferase involved in cell wall biosynthesis
MTQDLRPTSSISVIIPVFNRAQYIGEAISSVLGQIRASLQPQIQEIIIADDGSTDNSLEIAQGFGPLIRCVSQPNQGAAAARNLGIQTATGDLLAFLDSDDRWSPHKLQQQSERLMHQLDLDFVLGHVHQFISPELPAEAQTRFRVPANTMPGYHVGAMLIRRESFLKVGYFDPTLRVGEFVQWYDQAQALGLKHHMLSDVVMERRLHQENLGHQQQQAAQDYLKVIRGTLERKKMAMS